MNEPVVSGPEHDDRTNVSCPFAEGIPDETALAAERFGNAPAYDEFLGFYTSLWIGHVMEGDFRTCGSSGGLGNWILAELLQRGLVDTIVHVMESDKAGYDQPRFRLAISRTAIEVQDRAKSRYSPVELSEVLGLVRRSNDRVAIAALPCYAKALRLLCRHDSLLNDRVRFVVGLFCGHLKSEWFGASLAWQCGVASADVRALDFRLKLPDRSANRYGFRVIATDGRVIDKPMEHLLGKDWNVGFFKPKACDFCDDVVAETADISVGDAWLPGVQDDWQGTNVCVVRHPVLHEILEQALRDRRVHLTPVDAETIRRSQLANYRHRREELPYRLWLERSAGRWHPRKRATPSPNLKRHRRKVQLMRARLRDRSTEVFKEALEHGDLERYVLSMRSAIAREQQRASPLSFRITRQISPWRVARALYASMKHILSR